MPTCQGLEHLNFTVADLEQATAFFVDVFGCQVLYTMGPFQSSREPFTRVIANADVRSVVRSVRVLRSPFLNIELFEVSTPRQRPLWPDLLDVGGWGLGAYVDELDAAAAFLETKDVFVLGDGERPAGALPGRRTRRYLTPWGLHVELVSFTSLPGADVGPALWDPAHPGDAVPAPPARSCSMPGFRGFERIRVTVADLDEATRAFQQVLGCVAVGTEITPSDRDGGLVRAYANADARAEPSRARMLRSPYLNVELVECRPYPGQVVTWPSMFDVGGWHLAAYVDDMDKAYAFVTGLDLYVLGEKKPAYQYEAGAGAFTLHGLLPFGLYFELVTYPNGRYRASEHNGAAWHPGHPGHPGG